MSVSHSGNLEWINRPTPTDVLRFLMSIVMGESFFRGKSVVVLIVLGMAALGLRRRYALGSPTLWLLVGVPVVAVAALVVVSLTRPLVMPRYAAWAAAPALLAVAAGWEALSSGKRSRATILVGLACSLAALVFQFRTREKEDWHSLAAIMEQNPSCRGPVAFGSPPFGLAYFDPALLRRPLWRLEGKYPSATAEHYLLLRFAGDKGLPAGSLRPFMQQHPGAIFLVRGATPDSDTFADFNRQLGAVSFHRDLGAGLQLWCR